MNRSFPTEEANGVASTANPFDTSGVDPRFDINVHVGDNSVVQPDPSNTTDQLLYYYDLNGAVTYLGHSNLIPEGETVSTSAQVHELGVTLKTIHRFFYSAYGQSNPSGWYAMDVEFKFEGEEGEEPALYVKQARPYPWR